jgi:hypothetical protein
MEDFDKRLLYINGNVISYDNLVENIRLLFEKLGYCVKFFWGFDDINKVKDIINNLNKNEKYIFFITNDYNDDIIKPDNLILYRTGLYKSLKKKNEFVFPVIHPSEIKYSVVNFIEPVIKTQKPKICFAGSYHSYKLREFWLNSLQNSDKLDCNFIEKIGFRGGTIGEMIENYKTSEFCFCPRGAGNFSIRFYETLNYGRIPIVIDTDTELPFKNQINWEEIIVLSNNIEDLIDKVYDFWQKNDIVEIQLKCKKIYDKFFSLENISNSIFEEINF